MIFPSAELEVKVTALALGVIAAKLVIAIMPSTNLARFALFIISQIKLLID